MVWSSIRLLEIATFRQAGGRPAPAYILTGASSPHRRLFVFATLSSVTNPDPPVAAGDDLSFNIEAGNGHDTADNLDRQSAASEGDVPHDTAWASDVMFFTLFKSNPEQAVVAHMAPSVKGGSLCVSLVHVQHVDTDAERVTVHFGRHHQGLQEVTCTCSHQGCSRSMTS